MAAVRPPPSETRRDVLRIDTHTHRLAHSRSPCSMLIESRLQGAALASGRLSRCASAALALLFNLCCPPISRFLSPLHKHNTATTTTQLSLLSTLLCICVFLLQKTSRRAIPFTSSRRPISLFAPLFVFLAILEASFHSSASRWISHILRLLRTFMPLKWACSRLRSQRSLLPRQRNVLFRRRPPITSRSSPRLCQFLAKSPEWAIISMLSRLPTVERRFVQIRYEHLIDTTDIAESIRRTERL